MTSSPVLFLVFNRPEQTAQVFEAIRRARPRRLYVSADGPRGDRPQEAERCAEVRRLATAVDWPCEVRTLFRETNLGCKYAVAQGIDWFFENEEEGIIVEDDCLPVPSFFPYCDELLERYRHDERVMAICGSNTLERTSPPETSYFFSRHCRVWGWATWRRAWRHYDVEMRSWPAHRRIGLLRNWSAGETDFQAFWTDVLDRMAAGEIDTWDYQWMYACWANSGLSIRPYANMVANIGFGEGATHTLDSNAWQGNLPTVDIEFPLIHPAHVIRDVAADKETQQLQFGRPIPPWRLDQRLVRKVRYFRDNRRRRLFELREA